MLSAHSKQIVDDRIRQAHEGDFRPWLRRVDYLPDVTESPIRSLGLDLTARPGWGVQLRRDLVQLTEHDLRRVHAAMRAP